MDAPDYFRFPFEPYPIQLDFMKSLYKCIEEGKLGIFESPTGTGKSLSLICGTLTWLEDHDQYVKNQLEKELNVLNETLRDDVKKSDISNSETEPAWFTVAKKTASESLSRNKIKEELKKLSLKEERINKLKERAKQKLEPHELKALDTEFGRQHKFNKVNDTEDELLIEDYGDNEMDESVEEPCEEMMEDTKIIFASRTHSQISQFVREVKKSPFGKNIRLCSLASRQQLCINEEVTSLKNSTIINEKCLEMQKKGSSSTLKSGDGQPIKKSKKSSTCLYLDKKRIQFVRDKSLIEVADVENLVLSGKKHKACPYYASRNSLSDAQLIAVPYATLLKKSTRDACGLKLRNNVVVIDEAHNLLETISSMHSISIWGHQLSHANWQLSHYQAKFIGRLSAKNLLLIKQLLFFLSCLMKALNLSVKSSKSQELPEETLKNEERIYDCSTFCTEAGFDHLNIHTLVDFCEKSRLPQKLLNFKPSVMAEVNPIGGLKTFLERVKPGAPKESITEDVSSPEKETSGSPLLAILEFMRCLGNPDEDGRVLCVRNARSSVGYLKYMLLNPGSLFNDFVKEARAVIVAGGTMQPISEFQFQLYGAAGALQERIMKFSCGHIVPREHVLPIVLTRGPSNKELDFSWASRCSLIDELANLLLNVNQVVSGGVVCFLPSYDFESQVMEHFKSNGYIAKLENRKTVFREPKEANQVDQTLIAYARSINQYSDPSGSSGKNGALLLCVIGGKLSEGINFSDDLARCVIVVGLPYPNSQSAALKEKMDYLNLNMMNLRPEGEKRLPGQLHYESLCFKAVNQSIGRAIRHSKDYAVLILADYRYARSNSRSSLPEWITNELVVSDKFGRSLASIRKFLSTLKQNTVQ